MKALPKTTGIVFVVLVQINRDATDSAEPARHNIRESGQLEQDMALGIFLWREATKDPLRVERGDKWDYHAKIDGNRFGPDYHRIEVDLRGDLARMREKERVTSSALPMNTKAACGPSRRRSEPPPLEM